MPEEENSAIVVVILQLCKKKKMNKKDTICTKREGEKENAKYNGIFYSEYCIHSGGN